MLYMLAFVGGLVGYRTLSGATSRQGIRIIGGGASGAGVSALLEGGATYSYFASAINGGMGTAGYVFVGSFVFLCAVWIYNYLESKETLVM